jgi:hypothetical protein
MAGFFQEFLQGAKAGFFGTQNLRDYKHASKTFRTNAYGNAPKFKWLFHVYFEINETLTAPNLAIFPDPALPGLLVKNINLPKFSIQTAEMNQYNRRRYVQTSLKYDPINITFHDDNSGTIRNLWYQYFSYYYNDPNQPLNQKTGAPISADPQGGAGKAISALNQRTTYAPDISQNANWGYRGEVANTATSKSAGIAKAPFFKSIKIYGFNQHSFTLYELINPIIERFDHDTYDYYQSTATMENKMTIKYETVKYQQGSVNGQKPSVVANGFATEGYYDRELSPIARPGANRNILGQGGLVDAGEGIISDLSNGNLLGAIQKGGTVANTFKNSQNLFNTAKAELVTGIFNATQNPSTARSIFNFPTISSTTGTTAQQVTNYQVIPPTNNTTVQPVATTNNTTPQQ